MASTSIVGRTVLRGLLPAVSSAALAAGLCASAAAAQSTGAAGAAQNPQPGASAQTAVAVAGQPDGGAPGVQDPAATIQPGDEVVVTGFRRSLQSALNVKRRSVAAIDVIVAEDIAKFPDQNLAESLQRIPGISIERDAGEGRAITVRGLGAQFTRVRVNGMETIATSTDGASANRDRGFDFNVFASELFSSIVVHKTAEASLDEGSLGAVVDLNTGNALSGKSGLTFVASAQAGYNDLSRNWGPRVAGLVGWKNGAGTLAAQLSAAFSKTNNLELGNNTVRWEQARFDSVNGTSCWYQTTGTGNARAYTGTGVANSGGAFNPNAAGGACGEVALAFHPRIPRYGEVGHDRRRLGVTGSVQFAPSDRTRISLDALYSTFKEDRTEMWGEVLFRGNQRRIDVANYSIDPETNTFVTGTFNDAWVRTENYLRKSKTKFHQLGATWDQDLTDDFRFTLLGGLSRSAASIPVETTMIFDDREAQGYQIDYTDSRFPVLAFGTSVTDPANFQLAEIRDRPSSVTNKFRTAQLRTELDLADGLQIKAGALHRRFTFDTEAFQRDTTVCAAGLITCSSTVYGLPVTADIADLFKLGDAGQPSGTTTEWLVPNLDATTSLTGLYGRTARPDLGNTRGVTETVNGGYVQVDLKSDIFGLEFAANMGARFVRTKQSSTGLLSGVERTVTRSYQDLLPAANIALYPTKNVIIRAAAAEVITRPSLGQLTPGGGADGFNFRINYGNPELEPYRATSLDLAAEWYFAPESIISVALFKKDVDSFPVGQTTTGVSFNQTGLPLSVLNPASPGGQSTPAAEALRAAPIWQISQPVNGRGAKFKGVELAIQGPFRFLPGMLSNFGGIANATFVSSTANYTLTPPWVGFVGSGTGLGNFANVAAVTRSATFFPLSRRAFNGTLYYDDGRFSARTSVSFRSRYLDSTSGNRNLFEGFNSTLNVDAALRYKLNEQVEFSLEGINLTDEYRDRFTDIDANRNYENNHFGRTFLIGARYRM